MEFLTIVDQNTTNCVSLGRTNKNINQKKNYGHEEINNLNGKRNKSYNAKLN
jgi:hypothetical protein